LFVVITKHRRKIDVKKLKKAESKLNQKQKKRIINGVLYGVVTHIFYMKRASLFNLIILFSFQRTFLYWKIRKVHLKHISR